MKTLQKYVVTIAAFGALLLSPMASATPFSITAASFSPGSGYGLEANDSANTQLDVRFSTTVFSSQNFPLTTVGQSFGFDFGTVDLQEPNGSPGITANETDNLGVTASFTFANPLTGIKTISATGNAVLGFVNDQDVDYTLTWNPMDISFGTSGSFRLTINNLSFSGVGPLTERATITLLALDTAQPANSVPEPTSCAIFGLGALCLAFSRKMKK